MRWGRLTPLHGDPRLWGATTAERGPAPANVVHVRMRRSAPGLETMGAIRGAG
jgi:hypothetical protein